MDIGDEETELTRLSEVRDVVEEELIVKVGVESDKLGEEGIGTKTEVDGEI